ncbi:GtrA family protein, partial [Dolosigranulum pigrum]
MLENLFKKYKLVLLYLFFGGVTTVVNILIFYITFQILNLSTFTSTVLSWLATLIIAFITNKQFVFQSVSWNNKIIFKEFMLFFSYR